MKTTFIKTVKLISGSCVRPAPSANVGFSDCEAHLFVRAESINHNDLPAFITLACNSHYELLAACVAARDYLSNPAVQDWLNRSGVQSDNYGRTLLAINEALEKAGKP